MLRIPQKEIFKYQNWKKKIQCLKIKILSEHMWLHYIGTRKLIQTRGWPLKVGTTFACSRKYQMISNVKGRILYHLWKILIWFLLAGICPRINIKWAYISLHHLRRYRHRSKHSTLGQLRHDRGLSVFPPRVLDQQ